MTRARDVANLIGSGNYSSTTFTATAGQTVFSIAHTQNFVQVFMNGLLLDLTVDYTSNGSAVTLTSGAAAGDEIEVVAYNTFSVGDALNQAAADTRYVNTTGDTMTGNLGIGGSPSDVLLVKGTSASDGIKIETPASPSLYTAKVEFARDGTSGGAKIQTARNASVGGVGLSFNTTANNSAEVSGTYVERMKIDEVGRVTMPSQPSFVVNSVPGNFATGQVVNWQTEEYDRGNNFDMSNNRFTAPVAGFYHFSLIVFTNRITSTGDVYWDLRKNGSNVWRSYVGKDGSANVHVQVQGSTQVYLAANDYIDVYFAASIQTMDNASIHNRFSGYLIG